MTAPQSQTAVRHYAAVLAATLLYVIATSTVRADARADPTCSFDLSAPQWTTAAGGVRQITATVKPIACEGTAFPMRSTVCVSVADSASKCASTWAWNTAQVFVDPGSSSYASSGNGCVTYGNPSSVTCNALGPKRS